MTPESVSLPLPVLVRVRVPLSVMGPSNVSVPEVEFWTTARLLAKIKLPDADPPPLPTTIFPTAPESTVMVAGLLPSPIVRFWGELLLATLRRISKPVVTLPLNVSERTILSCCILPIVRLFALVFLKRRSVVALKVGTAPSQLAAASQLPVVAAALPFHVVPAVA